VENKNAVFNMIYHEKQIWNYRVGVTDSRKISMPGAPRRAFLRFIPKKLDFLPRPVTRNPKHGRIKVAT